MKRRSIHILVMGLALLQACVTYAQCASPGKDANNYQLAGFPNTYYSPAAASQILEANSSATILLTPASIVSTTTNSAIRPGDMVAIIQMQGAAINTSNDLNYGGANGSGSGYYHDVNLLAGQYEYAVAADGTYVTAAGGGTIVLANPVKNRYVNADADAVSGQYRYQIIKVPQFENIKLATNIVAPGWNGHVGGIILLEINGTCDMNGFSLIADGKGFRGGGGINYTGTPDFGAKDIFRYSSDTTAHASKGEGIAGTPRFTFDGTIVTNNGLEGYPGGSFGKGAPANAGGGSTDNKPAPSQYDNQLNTGGAGGANGGNGGKGGWPWNNNPGVIDSTENGGRPGAAFLEGSINRIIMGGGGGAGSANNAGADNGIRSSGAAGGGSILIRTRYFSGAGIITANGANALLIPGPSPDYSFTFTDASGGGGGGGTILLHSSDPSGLSMLTVSAKGGKGGTNYFGQHGPGGGGGGGVIYSNGALALADVSGGLNGQTGPGTGNNNRLDLLSLNYGAVPGNNGILLISSDSIDRAYCTILSSAESPLLKIEQEGNTNMLSWRCPLTLQASTFLIEQAPDGRNWKTIGEVNAANATTLYNYPHTKPEKRVNYYRVKAVAANGSFVYSNHVQCNYAGIAGSIGISRLRNNLYLNYQQWDKGTYQVRLMDMSGKILIRQKEIILNVSGPSLPVALPDWLPGGYYIINLTGPANLSFSEKIYW